MSENLKNEEKSEFCARISNNLDCKITDYFKVNLSLVLTSARLVVLSYIRISGAASQA